METRKLEIKDICGYFPYKLKGIAFGHNYKQVVDMSVIASDFMIVHKTFVYSFTHPKAEAIPLLRPLSDLYNSIIHNGMEIVPIVECAKISFSCKTDSDKFWKLNEDRRCAECDFPYEIMFFYEKSDNNFKYSTRYSMMQSTNNQYQLFDYLHELKIDYRGLIDAGLAVDVNTLNENPYK